MLGGIGAYTAHADTTIEITQSNQAEGSNQSSQNNNSDNSVVLTQPLTTQSNQTVLSNQSEQSTPATQATPTAVTNITTTNSFNKINPNDYGAVNESNNLLLTQKNTNDSSLWYTPSVSGFEGDVERSGLGDVERKISDPVYPNITVYYSFFHSTDNPEIQKYAHKGVGRDIYIKDPQTGVESFDRHDQVNFNRWVAVDTTRNNQLVGLGPWVLSLTSPKSFPKYNIPQKNGYTSYCNGKKATMIDEEQVSGNQPDEIYHITYVPTSSLVDKKTRTIIIKFPDGKQESTIQNTVLSDDSTCIWPKYVIPARDGYDSYVDGLKASVIPGQTVDVNDDDNVVVNVTYQKSPTPSTPDEKVKHQRKTITRTILVYNINGQFSNSIDQTVNYTRDYIINGLGDKIFLGDWSPDGNGTWDEYIIPQYEGYKSQVDSKDATVVPSQYVNLNDKDVTIDVTYKKVPSKGQHKAITRTIKITDPSGYVQTIPQTVNYTYHVIKIGSETLVGWVADTNDSWDEYAIPQHKGFISQVDSKDATVVPSQHVNSNDKNVIINVTYKKAPATSTSKQYKTLTRIISIHDINNIVGITQITQTVNYTRNIVTDAQGNIVSYTDWVVDGNDTWDEYAVPQQVGFISQVDSKDATIVPSQHVNPNDKNVIINVTYKKDPTMLTSKTITRTIHIFDINGQFSKTISQAVNYTRYWGSTGFGNEGFSDWEADGNDTWDEYAIPQHEGYKSQVNSKDATVIPSQHVTSNDKDIDITVTYIKTDNSKGNGKKINTTNTGWNQQGDDWLYMQKNGYLAKGWNYLNGHWFYFDLQSGIMKTGIQSIGNSFYYLNAQHDGTYGAMKTGWQFVNGHWIGLQGSGNAYVGWQAINGHWYYFDPQTAYALTNWQDINNHWYYFDPINAWAQTGWFKSGAGYWYFFDYTNAWALTNWAKLNNHWYYFDNTNANALTGWQSINSHWYYFDPTNAWARTGWQWINGHWYWFDEANAWALTGWQYYGGQWYFMDQQNAWMDTGWTTNLANGQLYYLDKNGHPLTGWQRSLNGFWYYLQPGSDAAAIGWNWINGHWYYFNPEETINGIKAKGAMFTGRHFIDNRWNRFDLNGHWLGYEN